ncbi:hypothetical protein ACEQ8H_001213 [Pleosporales sp. CAS-2024a]
MIASLLTKLFKKTSKSKEEPRPPFNLHGLPPELLLVVFRHLPTCDLYHFSAILPRNYMSELAKQALLRRVFSKHFKIRISWCCCSCAQMEYTNKLVLQDHLNSLLYPWALNFSTVQTTLAEFGFGVLTPPTHKKRRRIKTKLRFVLEKECVVKLDIAKLQAIALQDGEENADQKMQFLDYYFRKLRRDKRMRLLDCALHYSRNSTNRYRGYEMAPSAVTRNSPKKPGKFKRFLQKLCIPVHRKTGMQLESSPAAEKRKETLWLGNDSIAEARQNPFYGESVAYCDEHNGRESRGRYRMTVPKHPASRSQSRQNIAPDRVGMLHSRSGVDMRPETISPEYDAPRQNGRKRERAKTPRNKDLPGALRAQPPPLTRSSLERNSQRHDGDDARLIGCNPGTLLPNESEHNSPWDEHRVERESFQQAFGTSQTPARPNIARKRTHDWVVNTRYGPPVSSTATQASTSSMFVERTRTPERYRKILPIRDASDRVLCHSRSRGYMVVRRLISLEGLRDSPAIRKAGSLIGIMEDERNAVQEMSGRK